MVEQRWTGCARDRYEWSTMEIADVSTLWPRWMVTAGMMAQLRVLVRRRCCRCGSLMRVEPAEIAAREGAAFSLIDRLERCAMVGCDGSTAYLASRTYGRAWTLLLRDPKLIETFEQSSAKFDARIE